MYDVIPVTSDKPLDCGPTCLKMLLGYYGVEVPLEQLTEECGVTVAGCTGADLMRVGREHGLDMQCYSMDADELVRQDRPAIVHWRYNHFVVFAGRDTDGRVAICNPDRGRYRMTEGTFAAIASGLDDHPGQVIGIFNGEPHDTIATAPGNYAAGEVFELGGILYRALVAIARGETMTEYNVQFVDMAATINNLESKE